MAGGPQLQRSRPLTQNCNASGLCAVASPHRKLKITYYLLFDLSFPAGQNFGKAFGLHTDVTGSFESEEGHYHTILRTKKTATKKIWKEMN